MFCADHFFSRKHPVPTSPICETHKVSHKPCLLNIFKICANWCPVDLERTLISQTTVSMSICYQLQLEVKNQVELYTLTNHTGVTLLSGKKAKVPASKMRQR